MELDYNCLKDASKKFNESHNLNYFDVFTSLLYEDIKKCKICGNHIVYYDTSLHYRKYKDGAQYNINGKSWYTKKLDYNLCICEKCLTIKFPEYQTKNKSRVFNRMCKETQYAFDIPDVVYEKEKRKFVVRSEENFINKFGNDEGKKRWNLYKEKQSITNSFEYKHKKYNITEEKFNEFNKSRAVTLENLKLKFGDVSGELKYNEYCDKQKHTKSLSYMITKFGFEKSLMINKAKGRTLENYIKKYGITEGTKKFNNTIQKHKSYYSKVSQDFFDKIDVFLNKKFTTYYATKNCEYGKMLKGKYVKLDYYIKELNLCLEFYGTYFHGDPRIFSDNDFPNFFAKTVSAKTIWDSDENRRNQLLEMYNIQTIIIWELDYNKKTFNAKDYIANQLNIEL